MIPVLNWRDALMALDWSKAEFARRLEVHENTVLGWRERCPGYARAYLKLAVEIKKLNELVGRGK